MRGRRKSSAVSSTHIHAKISVDSPGTPKSRRGSYIAGASSKDEIVDDSASTPEAVSSELDFDGLTSVKMKQAGRKTRKSGKSENVSFSLNKSYISKQDISTLSDLGLEDKENVKLPQHWDSEWKNLEEEFKKKAKPSIIDTSIDSNRSSMGEQSPDSSKSDLDRTCDENHLQKLFELQESEDDISNESISSSGRKRKQKSEADESIEFNNFLEVASPENSSPSSVTSHKRPRRVVKDQGLDTTFDADCNFSDFDESDGSVEKYDALEMDVDGTGDTLSVQQDESEDEIETLKPDDNPEKKQRFGQSQVSFLSPDEPRTPAVHKDWRGTPLRSCLSAKQKGSVSALKNRVSFGSPTAAEFNFREPVENGMTPLRREVVQKRFSLIERSSVDSPEPLGADKFDEDIENERLSEDEEQNDDDISNDFTDVCYKDNVAENEQLNEELTDLSKSMALSARKSLEPQFEGLSNDSGFPLADVSQALSIVSSCVSSDSTEQKLNQASISMEKPTNLYFDDLRHNSSDLNSTGATEESVNESLGESLPRNYRYSEDIAKMQDLTEQSEFFEFAESSNVSLPKSLVDDSLITDTKMNTTCQRINSRFFNSTGSATDESGDQHVVVNALDGLNDTLSSSCMDETNETSMEMTRNTINFNADQSMSSLSGTNERSKDDIYQGRSNPTAEGIDTTVESLNFRIESSSDSLSESSEKNVKSFVRHSLGDLSIEFSETPLDESVASETGQIQNEIVSKDGSCENNKNAEPVQPEKSQVSMKRKTSSRLSIGRDQSSIVVEENIITPPMPQGETHSTSSSKDKKPETMEVEDVDNTPKSSPKSNTTPAKAIVAEVKIPDEKGSQEQGPEFVVGDDTPDASNSNERHEPPKAQTKKATILRTSLSPKEFVRRMSITPKKVPIVKLSFEERLQTFVSENSTGRWKIVLDHDGLMLSTGKHTVKVFLSQHDSEPLIDTILYRFIIEDNEPGLRKRFESTKLLQAAQFSDIRSLVPWRKKVSADMRESEILEYNGLVPYDTQELFWEKAQSQALRNKTAIFQRNIEKLKSHDCLAQVTNLLNGLEAVLVKLERIRQCILQMHLQSQDLAVVNKDSSFQHIILGANFINRFQKVRVNLDLTVRLYNNDHFEEKDFWFSDFSTSCDSFCSERSMMGYAAARNAVDYIVFCVNQKYQEGLENPMQDLANLFIGTSEKVKKIGVNE